MKKSYICLIFSILTFTALSYAGGFAADESQGFNCYSIIVGKDASFDGSVLLAHNEDDFGDQIFNMYKVPEQSHNPGDSVIFKNKQSKILR